VVTSGESNRVKRNSTRFKCTANHTDFFFPTDRLYDDEHDVPEWGPRCSGSAA